MTQKWIEVHYGGMAYSVNVEYIACVAPDEGGHGSRIFSVGDAPGNACNADESYDEVMRMIREVENAAD